MVILAAGLAVAGCQSGDKAGGTDLGIGNDSKPETATEKITESELRAFCPPLSLRSGTAFYDVYKNRAEREPKNVVYQAAIDETTRSCTYNADGSATMTIAVAGRIVPGPAGATGNVTMPIRVAVLRGGTLVDSKLHQYTVALGDTSGATQFLYTDSTLTIPAPVNRTVQVLVGYDRGPDDGQ